MRVLSLMRNVLLWQGHAVGVHFCALSEHTVTPIAGTWVRQGSREIKDRG